MAVRGTLHVRHPISFQFFRVAVYPGILASFKARQRL